MTTREARTTMAHDFTDEELDYTPTPKAGPALPKLRPSPDFRFGAHTNKWVPDLESGTMLPDLVIMPVTPGSAGVTNEGDVAALHRTYEPQGWTLLDPSIMAEVDASKPFYVHKKRVEKGIAHLPIWVQPIPGSDRVKVDRALYRKFIEHVAGILPKPDEDQLQAALTSAEQAHAKYHERGLTNPLAKRRADEWLRKIDILRAALDEARGIAPEPEPEPEPEAAKAGKSAKTGKE